MGFGTASLMFKVSLVLCCLALLLHIIGYATNEWQLATHGGSSAGLWKACFLGVCGSYSIRGSSSLANEFRAIRALETIALILLCVAFVGIVVFICMDGMRRKSLRMIVMVASFLAAVCIIVGVIIYGADFIGPLSNASYSLALCVVAAGLALATGIVLVLDSKSG